VRDADEIAAELVVNERRRRLVDDDALVLAVVHAERDLQHDGTMRVVIAWPADQHHLSVPREREFDAGLERGNADANDLRVARVGVERVATGRRAIRAVVDVDVVADVDDDGRVGLRPEFTTR
jgi:hypothetical protein